MAERLIKKGKMSLNEIADHVPTLSFDELKKPLYSAIDSTKLR